jgi:hypothetical protein
MIEPHTTSFISIVGNMKTLEYNGATYFLDGAKPKDEAYRKFFNKRRTNETGEVDYFLAKRKQFFFHPMHLHEGYDDIYYIGGFLSDLKQPSEKQVRDAMIFLMQDNCGDGGFNRYAIKAGGGSAADSIFSSSLSIQISNPANGEDQWVVLMKKYSTEFKDVLITYDEIHSLFDKCSTIEQKNGRDLDSVKAIIGLFMHSLASGYFKMSKSPDVKYSEDQAIGKLHKWFPQYSKKTWEKGFEFFESRIEQSKGYVYEERPGARVNENHQIDCLKRMSNLRKIQELFGHVEEMYRTSATLPLVVNSATTKQLSIF